MVEYLGTEFMYQNKICSWKYWSCSCYCQSNALKWTVLTSLEILWFYSNVYVPFSNCWYGISHWKLLLKFKLLWRNYTKEANKIAYFYVFSSDVHFCEGWGKSYTGNCRSATKHIIYIYTTQKGHVRLKIFFISIIGNFMTMNSSNFFLRRSYIWPI